MKTFCTMEPSLMPRMLTRESTTIDTRAIAFCTMSSSGYMLEIAAAKASASAEMEPEDERKKFVMPHMKATRSP